MLAALLTLAGAGTACNGGCRGATLAAADVAVSDPSAPATFVATMMSRGSPVVSAELTFYYLGTRSGRDAGGRMGKVRTDGNGVARYEVPRGLLELAGIGLTITGFRAEFDPLDHVVNSVEYCSSAAEASIRPPVSGKQA